MSSRVNPAQQRAKADVKTARNVLGRNGVHSSGSIIAKESRIENRQHWTVQNASRLEVWAGTPGLKGRWAIEVQLVYDTEPAGCGAHVKMGSLGLQWEPEAEHGMRSFMRYDVDVRRQQAFGEPCHLNVLQLTPFDDRIHFRIPGVAIAEWSLGPTLEFLCSSALRDELKGRCT